MGAVKHWGKKRKKAYEDAIYFWKIGEVNGVDCFRVGITTQKNDRNPDEGGVPALRFNIDRRYYFNNGATTIESDVANLKKELLAEFSEYAVTSSGHILEMECYEFVEQWLTVMMRRVNANETKVWRIYLAKKAKYEADIEAEKVRKKEAKLKVMAAERQAATLKTLSNRRSTITHGLVELVSLHKVYDRDGRSVKDVGAITDEKENLVSVMLDAISALVSDESDMFVVNAIGGKCMSVAGECSGGVLGGNYLSDESSLFGSKCKLREAV